MGWQPQGNRAHLAGNKQRPEFVWELGSAVRDVQVAEHEHEHLSGSRDDGTWRGERCQCWVPTGVSRAQTDNEKNAPLIQNTGG